MPVQIGAKAHSFSDPTGLLSDCHRRIEMFLGSLQTSGSDPRAQLIGGRSISIRPCPYRDILQPLRSSVSNFTNPILLGLHCLEPVAKVGLQTWISKERRNSSWAGTGGTLKILADWWPIIRRETLLELKWDL
jgi:hypothetical protein